MTSDHDQISSGRSGDRRHAVYLLSDGSGYYEPLTGRLKHGNGILKARIVSSERAAERQIAEWQDERAGA